MSNSNSECEEPTTAKKDFINSNDSFGESSVIGQQQGFEDNQLDLTPIAKQYTPNLLDLQKALLQSKLDIIQEETEEDKTSGIHEEDNNESLIDQNDKKILHDSMIYDMNKIPKRSSTHKKSLRDRLEKIMGGDE